MNRGNKLHRFSRFEGGLGVSRFRNLLCCLSVFGSLMLIWPYSIAHSITKKYLRVKREKAVSGYCPFPFGCHKNRLSNHLSINMSAVCMVLVLDFVGMVFNKRFFEFLRPCD